MNITYLMEDDRTIRLCDVSGDILSIREDPEKNTVLLTLTGTLRNDVAGYLQDELEAILSLGMTAMVDLSGVVYMSSAAQQVFLQIQQKIDGTGRGGLRLIHPTDAVYAELKQTGISELLNVERGKD